MSTLTSRGAIAVLAATGALLLAEITAAPQANAATIYACVKKKSGAARIVPKKTKCKKGEGKLSWNIEGPEGKGGPQGAQGASGAGAKGETGPVATTFWAVVSETGKLARGGSATVSAQEFRTGEYAVVFNMDITKCAYLATIGTVGTALPPPGEIAVSGDAENPDAVIVETYDVKGILSAFPFHLAVFC